MTFRASAPALFLALAAAACASSPNGAARDLAGCYYFEQDETARQLNLPWGVRLTADSLTDAPHLDQQPNTYRAVTLRGTGHTTDFPFGYWQALPGDSVRIGYPSMGGFVLNLAVVDGSLTGQAIPVRDAGFGPRDPHAVRLDRARCPGEEPSP